MTVRDKAISTRKASTEKGRKASKRPHGKGLTFGFLMLVLFILGCIGVFMVAMHQFSISKDLQARKIEQEIASEKAKQKSLRVEIARLRSPGRVARVAQEQLDFRQPNTVIYIRYSSASDEGIAVLETYQGKQKGTQEQSEKNQASIAEERAKKLTRR